MLNVIPKPKQIHIFGARVEISATWSGIAVEKAMQTFCDYADRVWKIRFQRTEDATLRVSYVKDLPPEGYRILVTEDGTAFVNASDERGLHYAMSTLLLSFSKQGNCLYLPIMRIEDAPNEKAVWRGLSLDLARMWHPVRYIFDAIDLCWLYKINRLQLHFTDTQSFTLPTQTLPKLPTEGRTYTPTELASIVEYAETRGITLVPEVDMPGHCKPFQLAYPEIFGRYDREVFGKHGVMCLGETAFQTLEKLLDEVMEWFPHSPYIHIGGDEAMIENWNKCPHCVAYMKEQGLENEKIAYAFYIARMTDYVLSKGRIPVVWEGFPSEYNHLISKDVLVMEWDTGYQAPQSLLESGFSLINCSWVPMYVVTYNKLKYWSPSEILQWNMYSWRKWKDDRFENITPIVVPEASRVFGGQLCAWGDGLKHCSSNEQGCLDEFRLLSQRIPSVSERTWNQGEEVNAEQFEHRFLHTDDVLARLLRREL